MFFPRITTDSWEEHIATLSKLFERIREPGLTIKARKCEIGLASVIFLGHKIGGGCLQPLETTVGKLLTAKRPETKKQIRSFLGLAGHYRDFIPRYAEIARPLIQAAKKQEKSTVEWTHERDFAFKTLRTALTSRPILKTPDIGKKDRKLSELSLFF